MEVLHSLLASHMVSQIVEHMTIVLQKFQRQISGRVVLGNMLIGLKVFLYVRDTIFNLVAVVDVKVARELTCSLVNLNHGTEQLLNTHTVLERCWYHWHSEQSAQSVYINIIATTLKLIIHIECAHHTYVHINKLGCEIQIALKVRRVYHVNNHIRHFLCKMFAHVKFLGRITR